VLPHVAYQDVAEAAEWLSKVFGFREHYRYGGEDGAVGGVQMYLGDAFIMLERAKGGASPAQLGYGTQYLTVFVQDVEAHFAQASSEGARIVEALHETVYGELQYGVEDLDGHKWLFSRHARDADPREWGAVVAED